MDTINTLLLVLQVIIAVALIGIVLIQHGKGADAGAAFGSGASSTVFGSGGSGGFLSKATAFLAVLFLANSLLLAYLARDRAKAPESLLSDEPVVIEEIIDLPKEQPVQDSASPGVTLDLPEVPEE
ncbi:MAG: preprotein translocase subunit SecG [Gammaproteobacteria bacterium]|nr:preprotein translocase subunit SecG [Gammaproteobacteria bacterium]NIN61465.1 preprotein translocase subunit SecG [Gammaproteobacteria bacterium]NIO61232.1 preprotein translocase subunit SecG [Gammaproteobacteria bacterium]NIP48834.1 preprotein translocase subunit SecG [Gammaproteobacteria bacterium]NIQ09288.1 preprotein translocase subunit SecG [Gammaproteobacteria bacterium]